MGTREAGSGGVSLDGADAEALEWMHRKVPVAPIDGSRQGCVGTVVGLIAPWGRQELQARVRFDDGTETRILPEKLRPAMKKGGER